MVALYHPEENYKLTEKIRDCMNQPSSVPGEEQVQGDPFRLTQLLICVILPPCLMKDIFDAFEEMGGMYLQV